MRTKPIARRAELPEPHRPPDLLLRGSSNFDSVSIMNLAEVTTLRLGGPAREVVEATTELTLLEAVQSADADGVPVLLVAGGSNLVVADKGFAGRVVLVRTHGITVLSDDCGGVIVQVAAGEQWDAFVQRALEEEWVGVEALSGIPGSVGATPVQNVGAYGQEIADTLVRVRAWDRRERRMRTLSHADCDFGYRSSRFKSELDRFLVLDVTFQFRSGNLSAPVRYAQLAQRLGCDVNERVEARKVRDAVMELRRSKGMVLDSEDYDTWSAGSFFTNPVLAAAEAAALPAAAPRYPQSDGTVKTSAAWLIDQAGFTKGYGTAGVSISTKHTLALTNRGAGTTTELVALAREVRAGVRARFGVDLEPEPVLVGVTW